MSSDQDLPPTRPSSPTLHVSTTPRGSPGIEPSPSTVESGILTPVFSESTTPAGSPQGGYMIPAPDMAEHAPPKFQLVQDGITVAGPSTPRFPPHGYQHGDRMHSSSTSGNSSSSNDRSALPSQSRPMSLGSPQDVSKIPSRHGPGARAVHRRSTIITSMADMMPGPYFASASAPADASDEVTVPEQAQENTEDDPFVGTPIAHLSKGFQPVYEDSPINQSSLAEEVRDYVLPEIQILRASSTDSLDSNKTIEDETLYDQDAYNKASFSDGSPDRKRGPGLLSDRAGDYDLNAGKTFVGAPGNPENLSDEEVRQDYPLWEVKVAEDEQDIRSYDFAYCSKKAPVTERQWQNVQVWESLYKNAPWPFPMSASQLADDDNATVIIERYDLNMKEETFQKKYEGSFQSIAAVTFYNSDTGGREQRFTEDTQSLYPDTIGTDGDEESIYPNTDGSDEEDEMSTPNGSPAKAAEMSTIAVSPAPSSHSANTKVNAQVDRLSMVQDDEVDEIEPALVLPSPRVPNITVPTPALSEASIGQSPRKCTLWERVLDFFCIHRSSNEGYPRQGFFRRQMDRFKRQ